MEACHLILYHLQIRLDSCTSTQPASIRPNMTYYQFVEELEVFWRSSTLKYPPPSCGRQQHGSCGAFAWFSPLGSLMPWRWARLGPLRRSSASPPHMIHTWHHLTILATHCVVHRTTCLAIWWWTHAVTWQDVVDIRLLQASNKDSLTTNCSNRSLCVASTCLLRRAQPWSSPQSCLASAKSLHQLRMAMI